MPSKDPQKPTEIWTPPEQLTTNVMKMAWGLFVKWWEAELRNTDGPFPRDEETAATCGQHYRMCIAIAKALEEINNGG